MSSYSTEHFLCIQNQVLVRPQHRLNGNVMRVFPQILGEIERFSPWKVVSEGNADRGFLKERLL